MTPVSSRHSRGYILLAVLLLLAALVLLVTIAQQRAEDEGITASFERSDAQAQALAEEGLERTRAYLGGLLERDVDLDRALDPGLDTDCLRLPTLGGVTSDDHLPPFADGKRVVAPSNGKAYLRVPANDDADGAYFVRIDDNDDDAQDSPPLSSATSNNLWGSCLEGLSLSALRNNPVRDRDGMVWVTVIGVHPGTSLEGNSARSTLRVLVGPGEPAGLIAGGTVRMQNSAHMCGSFGDVVATGSMEGGCLCGASCSSGPPWNSCGMGTGCIAQAAGPQCTATSGRMGAGDVCVSGIAVPPPPRVAAWEVSNAPQDCIGKTCLPFYYLRMDELQPKLYGWDYNACHSPRSAPRVCTPAECVACWVPFSANASKVPLELHLSDADPGLRARTPSMTVLADKAPLVWRAESATGFKLGGGGCDAGDTALYPVTPGLGRTEVLNATFDYPLTAPATRIPRGVWFVEGNVRFLGETPGCTELAAEPGYKVSIIATGNIIHEAGAISFPPASPKGVAILAGRDLALSGASSRIFTCGTSAVVMAHEQVEMDGDSLVEAQLVAENASTCSGTVSGDAVQMGGSSTVSVPWFPPLPVGSPVRVRLFSESTY